VLALRCQAATYKHNGKRARRRKANNVCLATPIPTTYLQRCRPGNAGWGASQVILCVPPPFSAYPSINAFDIDRCSDRRGRSSRFHVFKDDQGPVGGQKYRCKWRTLFYWYDFLWSLQHDYKGRSSAPRSLALWVSSSTSLSVEPGFANM
jgi:hypothetical protein